MVSLSWLKLLALRLCNLNKDAFCRYFLLTVYLSLLAKKTTEGDISGIAVLGKKTQT